MMKLNVIYLFKKKRFQLRFKIFRMSDFKTFQFFLKKSFATKRASPSFLYFLTKAT